MLPFQLNDLLRLITPNALGAVFALMTAIFAAVSWVLLYHWSRYGYNPTMIGRMRALYFWGAGVCFALMTAGILLFES
ncbi:MAG: hypothetical protein AAB759_02895 [Patescibacteria group bacterium]